MGPWSLDPHGGISHEELFEARPIVESDLANRAAERAPTEDLAALRRAIADRENSRSVEAGIDADVAFHEAIFRVSGNRVRQLIFTVTHRAMLMSTGRISRRVDIKNPIVCDKAIYSAIDRRKPKEARRLMAEHLIDSKSALPPQETEQIDAFAIEQIEVSPRVESEITGSRRRVNRL